MKFKQFIKGQGAIASIFMGVFYAVSMLGIFLAGYTAIPGNIDRLPIAIVNDDAGEYGKTIEKSLIKQLPFKEIDTDISNNKAQEKLSDTDLALVIHIPKTFSADLQSGKTTSKIDFTYNEATATAASSSIASVAKTINDQLNANFAEQTAVGMLQGMQIPEKQAKEMAKQIEASYEGNIKVMNDVPDGMHNNMLPMFLTMALYVGAMIASMQLVGQFRANRNKASKKRLFVYMQLTAVIIGIIAGAISTGIAIGISDISSDAFLKVWGQQILVYWACFNFTSIMVFLLGDGGMVLNIPILLAQTIANGATVSYAMMYAPFQWLAHVSPMFYSVQAYYSSLFGSNATAPFILGLLAVGVGTMLINMLIAWKLHKPHMVESDEVVTEKETKEKKVEVKETVNV